VVQSTEDLVEITDVDSGKRVNVIDLPLPKIVPTHSRLKLRYNVIPEFHCSTTAEFPSCAIKNYVVTPKPRQMPADDAILYSPNLCLNGRREFRPHIELSFAAIHFWHND
jgi:hypothetical protein